MDRTRLSVNGWFHGSLPDHKSVTETIPLDKYLFPPLYVSFTISNFLNFQCTSVKNIKIIRKQEEETKKISNYYVIIIIIII